MIPGAHPDLCRQGQSKRWTVVEGAAPCPMGCTAIEDSTLDLDPPVYLARCTDCGTRWETRPKLPPGLTVIRPQPPRRR